MEEPYSLADRYDVVVMSRMKKDMRMVTKLMEIGVLSEEHNEDGRELMPLKGMSTEDEKWIFIYEQTINQNNGLIAMESQ